MVILHRPNNTQISNLVVNFYANYDSRHTNCYSSEIVKTWTRLQPKHKPKGFFFFFGKFNCKLCKKQKAFKSRQVLQGEIWHIRNIWKSYFSTNSIWIWNEVPFSDWFASKSAKIKSHRHHFKIVSFFAAHASIYTSTIYVYLKVRKYNISGTNLHLQQLIW